MVAPVVALVVRMAALTAAAWAVASWVGTRVVAGVEHCREDTVVSQAAVVGLEGAERGATAAGVMAAVVAMVAGCWVREAAAVLALEKAAAAARVAATTDPAVAERVQGPSVAAERAVAATARAAQALVAAANPAPVAATTALETAARTEGLAAAARAAEQRALAASCRATGSSLQMAAAAGSVPLVRYPDAIESTRRRSLSTIFLFSPGWYGGAGGFGGPQKLSQPRQAMSWQWIEAYFGSHHASHRPGGGGGGEGGDGGDGGGAGGSGTLSARVVVPMVPVVQPGSSSTQ